MNTLSLWSAANSLLPLATMRRTVDGRSRDSHLRSSCFLPQSYTRTAPAMPTMRCSLKPHSAVGISFIAVTWINTSLPSTTRYLPTLVSETQNSKQKVERMSRDDGEIMWEWGGGGGVERSERGKGAGSRAHDDVTCCADNNNLLLSKIDASAAKCRLVAVELDAIGYLRRRVTRALAAACKPGRTWVSESRSVMQLAHTLLPGRVLPNTCGHIFSQTEQTQHMQHGRYLSCGC